MAVFLKRFHRLIYPLLIVLLLLILEKGFNLQFWVRAFIAITVAYVLSPRKKIIRTASGERKQLTWIFLKKPIFIE